jgi:hypothetical protein
LDYYESTTTEAKLTTEIKESNVLNLKITVGYSEDEKKYPWHQWHDFGFNFDWKESRGPVVDHAYVQLKELKKEYLKQKKLHAEAKDYDEEVRIRGIVHRLKARMCLLEAMLLLAWQNDWDKREFCEDYDERESASDSILSIQTTCKHEIKTDKYCLQCGKPFATKQS